MFDKGALDLIFTKSGGIPRRINSICDLSLLTGFGRKSSEINKGIVERALAEFEQ